MKKNLFINCVFIFTFISYINAQSKIKWTEAPKEMKASVVTDTIKEKVSGKFGTCNIYITHNSKEQKIYSLGVELLDTTPQDSKYDDSQSVEMSPTEYFIGIAGCANSEPSKVRECAAGITLIALSHCYRFKGEHCWMYK